MARDNPCSDWLSVPPMRTIIGPALARARRLRGEVGGHGRAAAVLRAGYGLWIGRQSPDATDMAIEPRLHSAYALP